MRPSMPAVDGRDICKRLISKLAPGHFSISPVGHEGREMVTKIRSDSAGQELDVEFKATIHMEMSAFKSSRKRTQSRLVIERRAN